jgi:hypothetical protein
MAPSVKVAKARAPISPTSFNPKGTIPRVVCLSTLRLKETSSKRYEGRVKPVSRTELGERDRMGKASSARSQENGIAMEVEKILLPDGECPNVDHVFCGHPFSEEMDDVRQEK